LPPRLRSSTARAVAVAALVVDLMLCATAWRSMAHARRAAYDDAERNTRNLARVLAENLEGTIRLIDLALSDAKGDLERGGLGRPIPDPAKEEFLSRLSSRIPVLDGIRMADSSGRVLLRAGPGGAVEIADRDYFVRARSEPSPGLIISAPLVSRITGKRSVVVARRIDRADRAFGGVVYAVLAIEQFTRTLSSVDAGRDGAVLLRGADNGVIARFPERTDQGKIVGHKVVTPELEAILASGKAEVTFIATSPIDEQEKVNAFRRVGGSSFYLLVAASSEAFLESWRAEARRTAAAVALFVLLSAGAAWLLLRSMKRETETRFRALIDGAPIAVALTREARVLYVNREFVRTFAIPSAEAAIGRSIADGVTPADAARMAERVERRERGLPVEPGFEVTLPRPDGSAFRAAVSDATVELADGPAVVGFIQDITDRKRSEEERERLIGDLQKALAEVKKLSGMLPICAHCKKIRDDQGYWKRIETFIRERSSAEFTHGICPDCAARYFPYDSGGEKGA